MANISGALTVLPMIPVIKQISGVYYYTLGSQWHVNLPGVNNLNSRSYPTAAKDMKQTKKLTWEQFKKDAGWRVCGC